MKMTQLVRLCVMVAAVAIAFSVCASSSYGQGAPLIPGLCNTGFLTSACTGLVPIGSNDGNWQIAFPYPTNSSASPIPNPCVPQCVTPLTYEPAWDDAPDPAWLANDTISQWITPQVELSLGGHYIYETTFPVPAGDTSVTIIGQLLSDNETDAIYIGSGSFECIPVAGYPYDGAAVNGPGDFFSPLTNFTITNAPVTAGGTATLYFVVRNRGTAGSDNNPTDTGLRVIINPKSAFNSSLPNFTISASPSSITVDPGSKGISKISTVAENGFDSAITLSASGLPAGVTATFSVNPIPAPGTGSSTLTLVVGTSTAAGTYTITITGTGGSVTNTTSITLIVP